MLIIGGILIIVGFFFIGFGYIEPRYLPEIVYDILPGLHLTSVFGLILMLIGILLVAKLYINR